MNKIPLFRFMAAIILATNFSGCSQDESLEPVAPAGDSNPHCR